MFVYANAKGNTKSSTTMRASPSIYRVSHAWRQWVSLNTARNLGIRFATRSLRSRNLKFKFHDLSSKFATSHNSSREKRIHSLVLVEIRHILSCDYIAIRDLIVTRKETCCLGLNDSGHLAIMPGKGYIYSCMTSLKPSICFIRIWSGLHN